MHFIYIYELPRCVKYSGAAHIILILNKYFNTCKLKFLL